jgi:hypothetical protein
MKNRFLLVVVPGFLAVLVMLSFKTSVAEYEPQKRRKAAEEAVVIQTNQDGKGMQITIEFKKGKAHNHPLLAIWIEDMEGNYIQTLYVVQSIASSVFRHGEAGWGHWNEAVVRRPAALPYWGHQRGIKAGDGLYIPTPDNPVPDAYSGATPKSDFILFSRSDMPLPEQFRVLLEINQAWDWNQYWHNNKFPDDAEYKTSSQPALVYEASINMQDQLKEYEMKPIGHSHYSGKTGELFRDLSTLTSALEIAESIVVRLP